MSMGSKVYLYAQLIYLSIDMFYLFISEDENLAHCSSLCFDVFNAYKNKLSSG